MKFRVQKMFILLTVMVLFVLIGCTNDADKIEIVLDGGGVSGNYNSSISMVQSPANPYPYNTLEKLVEEWNSTQSKYRIKLNRNSMNGNRDAILGYLSTQTGPDIIYQTGTTIAEDLGNDYYVDMTDHLTKPNPYIAGNQKWSDVYDAQELDASRAPDGNFYSIGIDRNVAGIAFNKNILTAAGVDFDINTYGDFIQALRKVEEYSDANGLDIMPYLAIDDWYNIVLEGNLYGSTIGDIDVIRPNGVVDTEELARASTKGIYRILNGNNMDSRFQAYLELMQTVGDFFPANVEGYTVINEFIKGNVAFISTLGRDIIRAYRDTTRQSTFEMGVTGYPYLVNEDIKTYTSFKNDEVTIDERGIRRGISGIGTGWWITNSAMKKGTVDACVDFLQFITAPQNNGRMVNDLGFTLPLDLTTNSDVNELYQPLVDQYNSDIEKDYFVWHVFNSWGISGFNYWSKFTVEYKNLYKGQSLQATASSLNAVFLSSIATLIDDNSTSGAWDVDNW